MNTPNVKPVVEMHASGNASDLFMTFEAQYRHKLQAIPEGAGHKTPGVHGPGWIHGLRNLRMYDPYTELTADFLRLVDDVIEPGQTIFQAMFNRIGPKGYLDWHIDGPPYRERWHYIVTGETVYYEEQATIKQGAGFWYGPISYWVPHAVNNINEKERIALLIDLVNE